MIVCFKELHFGGPQLFFILFHISGFMNILNKNVAVTDSYKQVGTVVSTIPEIEIWVIRVLVAKGYFGSCYVCKQSLVGVTGK